MPDAFDVPVGDPPSGNTTNPGGSEGAGSVGDNPAGGNPGGGSSAGSGIGEEIPPGGGVITPGGGSPPSSGSGVGGPTGGFLLVGDTVETTKPFTTGVLWEGRILWSMGGRSYWFDPQIGEFTDAGYGYISSMFSLSLDGVPDDLFMIANNRQMSGDPQYWGKPGSFVRHTHQYLSLQSENTDVPFARTITMTAWDGDGPARNRLKRAECLDIWGEVTYEDDATRPTEQIGTITMNSDLTPNYSETYPLYLFPFPDYDRNVYPNPPRQPQGMKIASQTWTPNMVGYVLTATLNITADYVAVRQWRLNYSFLD